MDPEAPSGAKGQFGQIGSLVGNLTDRPESAPWHLIGADWLGIAPGCLNGTDWSGIAYYWLNWADCSGGPW